MCDFLTCDCIVKSIGLAGSLFTIWFGWYKYKKQQQRKAFYEIYDRYHHDQNLLVFVQQYIYNEEELKNLIDEIILSFDRDKTHDNIYLNNTAYLERLLIIFERVCDLKERGEVEDNDFEYIKPEIDYCGKQQKIIDYINKLSEYYNVDSYPALEKYWKEYKK